MITESMYIWIAFGAMLLLLLLVAVCYNMERKQNNEKIRTLKSVNLTLVDREDALSKRIVELEAENATLTSTKNLFEKRLERTSQLANNQRAKIEEYKQALKNYGYDFKSNKVSRVESEK